MLKNYGEDKQIFWEMFVEKAFNDAKFAAEFNKRKPWGKVYYDLGWGGPKVHVAIRNLIKKDASIVMQIYFDDNVSLYEKMLAIKDDIQKFVDYKLIFRNVNGDSPKARVIELVKNDVAEEGTEEYWNELVEWIKENAIKLKNAVQYAENDGRKVEKNGKTEWIIAAKPSDYDVIGAFQTLGTIDWKQSANFAVGDSVFIYVSEDVKAIRFKCKVNKINLRETEIDDSLYDLSGKFDGTYGRYMELERIQEYNLPAFGTEQLKKHNFIIPQGPYRVSGELMTYMDIVQKLLSYGEVIPEEYDGSYEWLPEIVYSYKKLFESNKDVKLTYFDLDAIYLLAVGTWKISIEKKKEKIRKSQLPLSEVERLEKLIDGFWGKACRKEYQNYENSGKISIGMFGTGFMSFVGKTTEECAHSFIEMCTQIYDMDDSDAEKIYDIAEKVINKSFRGMKAASASIVLHCFKPNVFPILNGNQGFGNIFERLGVDIQRADDIGTYIENCRKINKYRNENYTFKNYRVFDLITRQFEENEDIEIDSEVEEKMENQIVEYDNNLILYGPPGTGKTYNSAIYAVAICDGVPVEKLTDYTAVMDRYDELKKQGRIAFTTFHQSYGYEEFIEGIKPVVGESKDVSYTIESGIFKRFCENAKIVKADDIEYTGTVWTFRNRVGDKDIPSDFEESLYSAGVIKVEDIYDYKRQCDSLNDMAPGDWVVLGRNYTINAIGVVVDDGPEEIDDGVFHYQRRIAWKATGLEEDCKSINRGKAFSNFVIARSDIKIQDLQKLIDGEIRNEQPYVFIIDEINRGNISKIFGELITLIENSKREGMPEAVSAILPYSGETFSVPSNVYILGTMNTADRSIALMDTALRRRFQFVEMMPNPSVLEGIEVDGLDISEMLSVINKRIEFLYDREHTIGHAFFIGLREEGTIAKLASIFQKSVVPLLQEYFYEDYQKIQLVLGDNAKTAEEEDLKFIKDVSVDARNIFMGNVDDIVDLPEKSFSINTKALMNIDSYKKIMPGK